MRREWHFYRTREKVIKQMKILLTECHEVMGEALNEYGYSTNDKLIWDLATISVALTDALEHLGVKQ